MKLNFAICLAFSGALLLACQQTGTNTQNFASDTSSQDACGASKYTHLVGNSLPKISDMKVADDTRYYGAKETVATNNPKRLNFVVSTKNAAMAFVEPDAKVLKVFCG